MFGHPSQNHHMVSGIQAALKSSKTPKHLRPHLEQRMSKLIPRAGYNPKTAAKPQMTPKAIKQGGGSAAANSQVAAPPMPFQNKMNSLHVPAPKGPMKGVGSGKSANTANITGSSQGKGVHPSAGNPFPHKRSHGAARSRFYGG